jgi:hypothetical protein
MTGKAESRGVLVFRQNEVRNGGVVWLVAGQAGDGRCILSESDVRPRDWMSFDRMIELVSFVEIQVEPGIHFSERDARAPRENESVHLPIDLHQSADVASHTHILRRGVQMSGEITGMWRVAKGAVALLVGRMQGRICGQRVASKTELSGRGGKSDVGGPLHVSNGVADRAAHGHSGVNIFSCGLVIVTLQTFAGIHVDRENYGVRMKVGASKRDAKHHNHNNDEGTETFRAVPHVSEMHGPPLSERQDFTHPRGTPEGQNILTHESQPGAGRTLLPRAQRRTTKATDAVAFRTYIVIRYI